MQIGYNQATSMKYSSLEADVALCKKYGFDGLEMQTALMDKYMSLHSLNDLKELFCNSGVKAFPINAFTDFNIPGEGNNARLSYLCECANAAGADTVILVPGLREISPAETVEAIGNYAGIAAGYGIGLALEFLGFAESSVCSLEEACAIAEHIPGLRLVLDCAHIMGGTTDPSAILKLSQERIASVHINDLRCKQSGIYSDSDRVWPGDGDMILPEILQNLKTIGYDGIISIELFNEEYWGWPVEDIFAAAMEKTKACLVDRLGE